jgi:hypothetical protein
MDPSEFESRLKAGVGGRRLWGLRKATAVHTATALMAVGRSMARRTDLTGDDGEAVRAMGALLQMAGQLGVAAGRMLSGDEHYAGAALLRQVVEIEYPAAAPFVISWHACPISGEDRLDPPPEPVEQHAYHPINAEPLKVASSVGDVTVPLAGVSVTGSVGSVTPSTTVALGG